MDTLLELISVSTPVLITFIIGLAAVLCCFIHSVSDSNPFNDLDE